MYMPLAVRKALLYFTFRSLGGAVSAILASEQRFMGVILEVPLDSMQLLFHDFFRLTAYVMVSSSPPVIIRWKINKIFLIADVRGKLLV